MRDNEGERERERQIEILKKEKNCCTVNIPIMLKTSFPLQYGSSSKNCSIAISFNGIPLRRSSLSIPSKSVEI